VHRPVDSVSAFLTIGGLPARARELLDLPWTDRQERRYQRFARICRMLDRTYARLPGTWRMHVIPLRAFKREGSRA